MPTAPKRTYAAQAAEELRVLLRRHGITNRELAQACGRNEFWVGKRINGQVPMDLDELRLFASVLGVEPADLLPKAWQPPPIEDGDSEWAPRGSNSEPADYKFHTPPAHVTHSGDDRTVRRLLPRRPAAVPAAPRTAAA